MTCIQCYPTILGSKEAKSSISGARFFREITKCSSSFPQLTNFPFNLSVKLGVSIGVHETIGDLRTMLSNDTGIERGQILLAEIDDLTFRRTFKDSDPVSVIDNEKPSPSCDLFCIEILKHKESTEDDGAYILVTWVNVLKEGPIEKRFGSPYTIQVSREVLYEDLQKLLMKEMGSILHDDILIANQKVCWFFMISML